MGEEQRLLRVRSTQKHKKPSFSRYGSKYKKRVKEAWRRPRGRQNKQRRRKVSKPAVVKVGYGSPALVKGLHPSGLEDTLVRNIKELKKVDPEKQLVRIARTVGRKKRLEIEERAEEIGIKIINMVKEL
ncbi:MAG: 50S ribosomal protein L32e [Candidatus Methanolliviera sp. GoM_asphalt]|nr:MAG: 50S ribosomal protein L32e [Candidatus Methanolliviera sp. GoM_asphalt]